MRPKRRRPHEVLKTMIKNVLIAFDGSDQSRRAFQFGLEIAGKFQATLLVLGVVRLPEPAISVEIDAMLDRGREHFKEEFDALGKKAESAGVKFETHVAVGHPAEQILRQAEDSHADLIVMGRRGLTRATRWILGSVSERVLRYAHCPVAVIK
jgi:nucleotide-binding universal stress UspA family protein